ncbi:hypothetical protein N8J89_26245 [Crossiella sp. CA-258035]|uniref:hypothetical protein n=1 Tax=Crossiella sp. CA-258035 TaxID=2981138 RepID=UPI0024BC708B|nr:hypothetical protein [Crossiella sp. CA-258035]WHT16627.1 hypothetical protein N8J89_26245 [Crossiella sp. CA-258035]
MAGTSFEVSAREAAAQRSIEHLDCLLVATSRERDELSFAGLDPADPQAMFERLNDLTHRAAATPDPARLPELLDAFLANGTCHVPTQAATWPTGESGEQRLFDRYRELTAALHCTTSWSC